MLEKNLRMAMAATGYSELRSQATVNDISVDEQWVYCRYTDANGVEKRLRSKFFVGADGKTGFTRKRYLEERGIKMETISK
jgi:2-polyprenyl-6-methoxyphenol hydroxylase-like FAD-dependent oxidoreductase